jgi:GT2 family glycosyltransferase
VADPEDPRAGAVAVAYIYRGHNVTYSWHHSMIELIGFDLCHEGRVMRGGYVAMKCGADGYADARNKAVRLFLEEDRAEWLFWIDTDMGFAADTVERLLEAADPVDRPVVGGLAFTQQEAESDGLGGWRCRAAPTVFDWAALDDGQMGFVIRWKYPPDALTRVGGTGAACVLVHRSVFERLEAARTANPKLGSWYDRVPNTTTGQLLSEDLSMCLRAGALDIPVHVHTGVKTTHQKILWLAEDDYYGQVALSQLHPQVPPATEATAVIVPVLRRPQSAAPFMESLAASGAPLARVYAVADIDDGDTAAAWKEAGASVLVTAGGDHPGTFAEKVNIGYRATQEPWMLLSGDDVRFHPGWLDQAQHAARDGADVVGTNDLHNPRVLAGDHSPHPLVRRAYADEVGASWDGPGVVAHEGYRHWFVDDELVTAARQRGAWVAARHAKVEHLHPLWGLAADDETYALGREHIAEDRALFEARAAEHSA